jgi:uncharacterized protein YaiE (UPF0345 family)
MKFTALISGLVCSAGLLFSAASSASAANLVVNGSFEDTQVAAGDWKTFGAGEVNGWTPTKGSRIEIRNNRVGTAFDGVNFVEVDSHGYNAKQAKKGKIEVGLFQDIITEVGKKYRLSFAYGPRNGVKGDNLLGVSFGDLSQSLDAGNGGEGWKLFENTITATSDLTRLKFVTEGKFDTLGANIDNVSVEAVPEPMTALAVLAVGTALVGGAKKRKAA